MLGSQSLNKRILVPIISALIVSYVVIIVLSIQNSTEVKENTIEQTKATVESTSQSISNYFESYEKGIQLLASSEQLTNASLVSLAQNELQVDTLYKTLLPYNTFYEGVLST